MRSNAFPLSLEYFSKNIFRYFKGIVSPLFFFQTYIVANYAHNEHADNPSQISILSIKKGVVGTSRRVR